MGEIKRRNRVLSRPAAHRAEVVPDMVFFEQIVQREVRKAMRRSQRDATDRHFVA